MSEIMITEQLNLVTSVVDKKMEVQVYNEDGVKNQ